MYARHAGLKDREFGMAKVVVLVRIMPLDESTNIDNLLSKIKSNLPQNIELISVKTEPFVFGLNVINALFKMPDEEGYPNILEEYLRGFEEVGELEIISMSRASS
jgi:translation elongation factor aEF-1 beta